MSLKTLNGLGWMGGGDSSSSQGCPDCAKRLYNLSPPPGQQLEGGLSLCRRPAMEGQGSDLIPGVQT